MKELNVGVALSGGGLEGFAHIGALKGLEDLGVYPQYISGTSTGSIIAALYAMQYDFNEIEEICKEFYTKIFKVRKRTVIKAAINFLRYRQTRVEGLIDGKMIENFINKYSNQKGIKTFCDIKNKKLAIATVDSITMQECIFVSDEIQIYNDKIKYISDNATIGQAVRSSMAFPGIFPSVEYNEYNFIDGGTIDNLPTKVLKTLGAEKIIAIDFNTDNYKPTNNLEDVILRALDVYSDGDTKEAEKIADIVIKIYNENTSLLNIKDIENTIENGYQYVMKQKDKVENELMIYK